MSKINELSKESDELEQLIIKLGGDIKELSKTKIESITAHIGEDGANIEKVEAYYHNYITKLYAMYADTFNKQNNR